MEVKARNCLTQENKSSNHEGKSYSEIAGIVRVSKSVYRLISRFKADKTLEPKPSTERPPTTTKWKIG